VSASWARCPYDYFDLDGSCVTFMGAEVGFGVVSVDLMDSCLQMYFLRSDLNQDQ
jgi:hypothetical protein